ncbi:hypothetical protein UFOVP78_44 [uncultured Caudovirales phage]|uniref:Uncharacterized protein n=1 Tax=uncultured Caudovirales phage TaxID=2100421 RepID=A0A6J5KYD7_9CAUD|nr:hypothetical protein UFOVP78_44 [uncultured Caudovirales phage]
MSLTTDTTDAPLPNPALPGLDAEDAPQQGTEAFAILVATDGRLVRLNPSGGCLTLAIDGRKPVTLDRFQTAAFRQAVAAMPVEG